MLLRLSLLNTEHNLPQDEQLRDLRQLDSASENSKIETIARRTLLHLLQSYFVQHKHILHASDHDYFVFVIE
jgi:hypothetical protein